MKMLVLFLAKCVRTAAKTMVVDRKNQKALALLYLVSGPLRSCELKRCADRVRSRTNNKDEVLEGKFVTWTFRLPPKRQQSILLNFFFPFLSTSFWWPCGADGRTDGHVNITSLLKFLGLIGYQICLAMVLRRRAPLLVVNRGSCRQFRFPGR